MTRLRFRYDLSGPLLVAMGMGPSRSWIEIADGRLAVKMGWAFGLHADLRALVSAELLDEATGSKLLRGVGVHGFGGRWRVNGAFSPIVRLTFSPAQRGRVLGVRVNVTTLDVSPEDPALLLEGVGQPD